MISYALFRLLFALCRLLGRFLALSRQTLHALRLPQAFSPTFLVCLLGSRNRQRVGRNVVGHHRTGPDIGTVADLDRRYQRRIGADKSAGADIGVMLGDAVVIAGDGAGADIGARTDPGVADVAQMIGLGAGLDLGGFHLDEIADVDVGAEVGAGAQARIGADARSLADMRAFQMRER